MPNMLLRAGIVTLGVTVVDETATTGSTALLSRILSFVGSETILKLSSLLLSSFIATSDSVFLTLSGFSRASLYFLRNKIGLAILLSSSFSYISCRDIWVVEGWLCRLGFCDELPCEDDDGLWTLWTRLARLGSMGIDLSSPRLSLLLWSEDRRHSSSSVMWSFPFSSSSIKICFSVGTCGTVMGSASLENPKKANTSVLICFR